MNWNETKLKEYCKVVSGYAFKSDDFVEKGIPVLKIANISDYSTKFTSDDSFIPENKVDNYEEFVLKEKDIVIALSGNTTCKMGRVNNLFSPSLLNQRVGHFRILDEESLDENYLYFLMISDTVQKRLWNKATATGQPNLSPSDITKLNVNLPPKPEQQKIAAILTIVDDAIQAVKNTIEKAERLKKALMQNLLTGKLKPDGTWRRDDEFYEDEKFGKVPVGWEVLKIKEILKLKNGKGNTTNNLKTEMDHEYCIPVYGGNGITGYYYLPFLKKSTLIIGRVGEYCGAVYKTPELCWVTDNALYVSEFLIDNYDMDFLKNLLIKANLNHYSDSTGQPKITQSGIGNIRVILPSDKSEQFEIATKINLVENMINLKKTKIQKLERLKKALMQNLLTGKVRVKV